MIFPLILLTLHQCPQLGIDYAQSGKSNQNVVHFIGTTTGKSHIIWQRLQLDEVEDIALASNKTYTCATKTNPLKKCKIIKTKGLWILGCVILCFLIMKIKK